MPILFLPTPHRENKLCAMNLWSRVETQAKRRHLKKGKGLTSPLLVLGQVPGLQDELALHLCDALLQKEGLLEGGRRDGVLWCLRQQCSRWKMAHFNSIGMFMSYMEKNRSRLSVMAVLKPTLPWVHASHWHMLLFSWGFWIRKAVAPGCTSYAFSLGTPCKKQVPKEKIF